MSDPWDMRKKHIFLFLKMLNHKINESENQFALNSDLDLRSEKRKKKKNVQKMQLHYWKGSAPSTRETLLHKDEEYSLLISPVEDQQDFRLRLQTKICCFLKILYYRHNRGHLPGGRY